MSTVHIKEKKVFLKEIKMYIKSRVFKQKYLVATKNTLRVCV